ncbi:MAG TPA: shikimate dehydrogenase [Bacillota bacterium]
MVSFEINGNTGILAIFGHPVQHSLSPAMHNAVFYHLGWNYRYIPCDVPSEQLSTAIDAIQALNFKGVNLTIPHKQAAINALDEIYGDSLESGSVNTIIRHHGKLTGTSTDGIGFIRSLREEGRFDPTGKNVLLLGAGGTALAVVYRLIHAGIKRLTLINRDCSKAQILGERIRKKTGFEPEVHGLDHLAALSGTEFDLVVNSTSVGLHDDQALLPKEFLNSRQFVYDVVYRPGGTRLVNDARNTGCQVLSGLSLLIYQGAESFRLWFDTEPPLDIMRNAVLGETQ